MHAYRGISAISAPIGRKTDTVAGISYFILEIPSLKPVQCTLCLSLHFQLILKGSNNFLMLSHDRSLKIVPRYADKHN